MESTTSALSVPGSSNRLGVLFLVDFAHPISNIIKMLHPARQIWGWQTVNTSKTMWQNTECEARYLHPPLLPFLERKKVVYFIPLGNQQWEASFSPCCVVLQWAHNHAAHIAQVFCLREYSSRWVCQAEDTAVVLQYLEGCSTSLSPRRAACCQDVSKPFSQTRRNKKIVCFFTEAKQPLNIQPACQDTWIETDLQTTQFTLHRGGSMQGKPVKTLSF